MSQRNTELDLEAQLAEKNDLILALTGQLEKAVNQLDRLRRSGADRIGHSSGDSSAAAANRDVSSRLTTALDDWTEFRPTERIERIESGIDRILEILAEQQSASTSPGQSASQADFWAETKARLLGDPSPSAASAAKPSVVPESVSAPVDDEPLDLSSLPPAPEAPQPVNDETDLASLIQGVETRDNYIQYLTTRLRLAESKKFVPVNWELLDRAPEKYRDRLESLEIVLRDHLRQAEIASSLERAVLARERAKLAHVKQNLEGQIKRLSTAAPAPVVREEEPGQKGDPDSRWKRLFSR
ncbi:hypothetical protein [Planctomicrobium piriforme]|nr:hypothetical protein [Planctomicrobium piriforme]